MLLQFLCLPSIISEAEQNKPRREQAVGKEEGE